MKENFREYWVGLDNIFSKVREIQEMCGEDVKISVRINPQDDSFICLSWDGTPLGSLPLTQDSDGQAVERCCFCREKTAYWFTPKDVACCHVCALHATPEDVPTKAEWIQREMIIRGAQR